MVIGERHMYHICLMMFDVLVFCCFVIIQIQPAGFNRICIKFALKPMNQFAINQMINCSALHRGWEMGTISTIKSGMSLIILVVRAHLPTNLRSIK